MRTFLKVCLILLLVCELFRVHYVQCCIVAFADSAIPVDAITVLCYKMLLPVHKDSTCMPFPAHLDCTICIPYISFNGSSSTGYISVLYPYKGMTPPIN